MYDNKLIQLKQLTKYTYVHNYHSNVTLVMTEHDIVMNMPKFTRKNHRVQCYSLTYTHVDAVKVIVASYIPKPIYNYSF